MNRRQFIKLSLGSAALITLPLSVPANRLSSGRFDRWQDVDGIIPVTESGQKVALVRDLMGTWESRNDYGQTLAPVFVLRRNYN